MSNPSGDKTFIFYLLVFIYFMCKFVLSRIKINHIFPQFLRENMIDFLEKYCSFCVIMTIKSFICNLQDYMENLWSTACCIISLFGCSSGPLRVLVVPASYQRRTIVVPCSEFVRYIPKPIRTTTEEYRTWYDYGTTMVRLELEADPKNFRTKYRCLFPLTNLRC